MRRPRDVALTFRFFSYRYSLGSAMHSSSPVRRCSRCGCSEGLQRGLNLRDAQNVRPGAPADVTVLEGFTPVFKQWDFNTYQLGLAFVPIAIGYVLAYAYFIPCALIHTGSALIAGSSTSTTGAASVIRRRSRRSAVFTHFCSRCVAKESERGRQRPCSGLLGVSAIVS